MIYATTSLQQDSAKPSSTSAQTEAAKSEPAESFWQRTTHDPVAFFTLILALFTGALFVYTARLWGATKTLASEAKATAERQLRGYVFPEGPTNVAVGAPHEAPKFSLRIKNSGQTPVSRVRLRVQRYAAPFPLGEPFPPLGEPPIVSSQFIGPQGTINWTTEVETLSPLEIALHAAGTHRHYYQGDIRYLDAFGHNRTTKFLFWLRGSELAGHPDGNDWD